LIDNVLNLLLHIQFVGGGGVGGGLVGSELSIL
jgi:hypothetical protein